ncbi:hypothetical protein BpHYR1_027000 [Brachionus plicatilis]|uniref:Uncharacterized protein n=1 Tax=Brachionus plicatilis TaxID=10195 RepID=A0A3M7SPJ3_BRAPC|nr:hypothetical protein BpHYR1_027000 [Brachionus plicatilis]
MNHTIRACDCDNRSRNCHYVPDFINLNDFLSGLSWYVILQLLFSFLKKSKFLCLILWFLIYFEKRHFAEMLHIISRLLQLIYFLRKSVKSAFEFRLVTYE